MTDTWSETGRQADELDLEEARDPAKYVWQEDDVEVLVVADVAEAKAQ